VVKGRKTKLLTQCLNKTRILVVNAQKATTDLADQTLAVAPGSRAPELPHRIRSEDLFQGRVEVLIAHGAETYRLRHTRSGKLILQK
jgi:hemin uptake protein HemP